MANVDITYSWRGEFTNEALNQLHAEGFRHDEALIGFVNVAWDGALHAFILDTLVTDRYRHRRVATEMLKICVKEARDARCEWLHVDFDDYLRAFYFDRCGFEKTNAGLIKLA